MISKEELVLGSGNLYCTDFTGTLPEVSAICVEANRLAFISGGASLEYKPTKYTAKDDLGRVSKQILTDEEAKLKTGICTINGVVLEKLADTARIEDPDDPDKRVTKIGGVGNAKNAKYALCFHHPFAGDVDIYVLIVGSNEAGFTLAFAKDKETIVDAEFTCLPHDNEGTLIKYIEVLKPVG